MCVTMIRSRERHKPKEGDKEKTKEGLKRIPVGHHTYNSTEFLQKTFSSQDRMQNSLNRSPDAEILLETLQQNSVINSVQGCTSVQQYLTHSTDN